MNEKTSKKIINALSIVGTVLTVIFLWYAYDSGLLTDADVMENFLKKAGIFGPIVFIFIQIIQVVIPVIPGAITIPVGSIIFGAWVGFIYNYIGIIIGSVINFYLARRYGRPLVRTLISQNTYDKYIGYLEHPNFEKVFLALMVWPMTPADFICYLAGLSNLTWNKYLIILTLTKPWTIYAYTYGSTAILNLIQKFLTGG